MSQKWLSALELSVSLKGHACEDGMHFILLENSGSLLPKSLNASSPELQSPRSKNLIHDITFALQISLQQLYWDRIHTHNSPIQIVKFNGSEQTQSCATIATSNFITFSSKETSYPLATPASFPLISSLPPVPGNHQPKLGPCTFSYSWHFV